MCFGVFIIMQIVLIIIQNQKLIVLNIMLINALATQREFWVQAIHFPSVMNCERKSWKAL